MKQLLGLIFIVIVVLVFHGADANIAWCVKVQEWFIGFIVWGVLALIVLSFINFFLSMLD